MRPLYGPSTQAEKLTSSRLLAHIMVGQLAIVYGQTDPERVAQERLRRHMESARRDARHQS